MNFTEYQALASRTNPPHQPNKLAMLCLGLAGESGEVVEMAKKYLFHGHGLDTAKFVKELGDVLWYLSQLSAVAGVSLEDVATINIAKLKERYPQGFSEAASVERKEP